MKSLTVFSIFAFTPVIVAIPAPQLEVRSFSLAGLRDLIFRRQSYGLISAPVSVSLSAAAQVTSDGQGLSRLGKPPHHDRPLPGLPHLPHHGSVTSKAVAPYGTHNASHSATGTASIHFTSKSNSTKTLLTTVQLETIDTSTSTETVPYPTHKNATLPAGTAINTGSPILVTGSSAPALPSVSIAPYQANTSLPYSPTGTVTPKPSISAPYPISSNATSSASAVGTGSYSTGLLLSTASAAGVYIPSSALYPMSNTSVAIGATGTAVSTSVPLYTNPSISTPSSSGAPYAMSNSSTPYFTATGFASGALTTGYTPSFSLSSKPSLSAPYPVSNATASSGPTGTGSSTAYLSASLSSTAPYPVSNSSSYALATGTGALSSVASSAAINYTVIALTTGSSSSMFSSTVPYSTSNATSTTSSTMTAVPSFALSTGGTPSRFSSLAVPYPTSNSTAASSIISGSKFTSSSFIPSIITTSASLSSSTSIPTSEIASLTSELPSLFSSILAHESTTTMTSPSGPTVVVTSHVGADLDIEGSTLDDVSISGFNSESANANVDVGAIASILDSELSNVSISGFNSKAEKRNLGKKVTCATGVYIVIARGSTEVQGAGAMGAVASSVVAQIPGSTIAPVVYPASLTDYVASEAAGDTAAVSMIKAYVDACPSGDIVLMGYSQGAAVVGDALCGDSEATAALGGTNTAALESPYSDAVKAVILMGDPAHVPGQPWDVGTSTKSGISPRQSTCTAFTGITQSYCDSGDEFCDSGTSLIAHLDYVTKYGTAATQFVVDTVKGTAISTTSAASVAPPPAATSSKASSLFGGLFTQLKFRSGEDRKHSREMK